MPRRQREIHPLPRPFDLESTSIPGPDPERNPFCPLQGALDGQLGERALAQFMKFSRCLNLIEAAEALDGKAYHRVVRTRPDLLWSRNHISVDLMKPEATIFSKYPDQHFVLPRVAADYLMRVYERYQRCNQSDRKDILFQQQKTSDQLQLNLDQHRTKDLCLDMASHLNSMHDQNL